MSLNASTLARGTATERSVGPSLPRVSRLLDWLFGTMQRCPHEGCWTWLSVLSRNCLRSPQDSKGSVSFCFALRELLWQAVDTHTKILVYLLKFSFTSLGKRSLKSNSLLWSCNEQLLTLITIIAHFFGCDSKKKKGGWQGEDENEHPDLDSWQVNKPVLRAGWLITAALQAGPLGASSSFHIFISWQEIRACGGVWVKTFLISADLLSSTSVIIVGFRGLLWNSSWP